MFSEISQSPYVGLRPFREKDSPFFFGRERDTRIISDNLLEEPLTVLYGPSGVGKSSVLQAGVIPYLGSIPGTAILYLRSWQSDSSLRELTEGCETLYSCSPSDVRQRTVRPDEVLPDAGQGASVRLLILLDQFEEYLLYHPADGAGELFDGKLARLVNRNDVPVNVLIGIREDSLSKLDQRFGIRIPNVLGNTLQVERLSPRDARDAIERPLVSFNEIYGKESLEFKIEPSLVDAILSEVQKGPEALSDTAGRGVSRLGQTGSRIETAYLQLILSKLWKDERGQGSAVMRYQTLAKMGGASKIVRNHVNNVMRTLESDRQRDIAARMFLHLVTPSRTKIAQRTEDLVVFAAAPEVEVRSVLNALSDLDTVSNKEQTRILRRLSHPEQYEIFHDVLAEHVLGWRQQYDGQRDRERVRIESEQKAEAERKQLQLEQAQAIAKEQTLRADEQAAAAKRLRRGLIALVAVLIVALTTSVYAYYQRRLAQVHLLQAQAFAKAEQARAEQALNEKAAALAEKAGQARKAEQYREQADQNAKTAQTWTEYASQQGASAYSNPHCNCDSDLQMKDFTPTAGRNDKWLIAQFDICRTNAMDDPSTTTTVDWGDPPGSPQPAALGDWLHGSPDIYGTHLYSKPGTFMVTARMETTCHYRGAGQCDYHCVADGHVRVNVKQ